MGTEPSDEQDALDMARLVSGHDAALNDLMERHGERLFHYLIRFVKSEAEAADLAQEAFVRVFQNKVRFDSKARFSTWLYTIATNLARTRLRWKTRHPHVSLDAENPATGGDFKENFSDQKPTPKESLESKELSELVREAVAALPEELRVPLLLAEYEEKSQSEIAEILGCSVKAVEMRIYHGRQNLREKLKKFLARE